MNHLLLLGSWCAEVVGCLQLTVAESFFYGTISQLQIHAIIGIWDLIIADYNPFDISLFFERLLFFVLLF